MRPRFPDRLRVGEQAFALAYRFAPGEDDDGVTVTIPLDVLVDLDPGRFEWLVPGMLEDKVLALLRALPKSLRRAVMPLAGVAREFIAGTHGRDGSLHEALARFLDRTRGVCVPRDAWSPDRLRRVLPAHRLMRFEVTDRDGTVLGRSRRLDEIERRLTGRSGRLGHPGRRAGVASGRGERGYAAWTFGAVPVEAEDSAGEGSGHVFPALRDVGSGVVVEHFQACTAAERSHRGGLVRLFSLAVRREARECLRALSGIDEICLLHATIASPPDWIDAPRALPERPVSGTGAEARADLVERAVARVFVRPAGAIREPGRFEAVLAAGRHEFAGGLAAVCGEALAILRAAPRGAAAPRCSGPPCPARIAGRRTAPVGRTRAPRLPRRDAGGGVRIPAPVSCGVTGAAGEAWPRWSERRAPARRDPATAAASRIEGARDPGPGPA